MTYTRHHKYWEEAGEKVGLYFTLYKEHSQILFYNYIKLFLVLEVHYVEVPLTTLLQDEH